MRQQPLDDTPRLHAAGVDVELERLTIGPRQQPEIGETPSTTTVEGDSVVTRRHMANIPAPPFWRMALRGNKLADDVPVDRWQICRFTR